MCAKQGGGHLIPFAPLSVSGGGGNSPAPPPMKQACAAEIAVLYAALTCKQNKRYHTSARLTKTRDRCSDVNNHGTDGQTDGQTDRQSATQYAALLGRRAA